MNSRLPILTFLFVTAIAAQAPPPAVTLIYSSIITPYGPLLPGPNGVLYGTTFGGGNGNGTVYELVPPASSGGAWQENLLYEFTEGGKWPLGGLIMDKGGNLYGTTTMGGLPGAGVVFQLIPPSTAGASWTERILHNFPAQSGDGQDPKAGLAFGPKGMLYGITAGGGAFDSGTVFGLRPPASPGGSWTESVLYSFGAQPGDGTSPQANLVRDNLGNLYGTTYSGGAGTSCAGGCGTVFQLAPPASPGGAWTETLLHSFTAANGDGAGPGGVTLGNGGNLFGTAYTGGISGGACPTGCGIVFQLAPPAAPGGSWTETVLYSFTGLNGDGALPVGAVVATKNGSLFGTTYSGGPQPYYGTVFLLSPPSAPGGTWTETVVPLMKADSAPLAGLTFGNGMLYGVGSFGGAFRVTP